MILVEFSFPSVEDMKEPYLLEAGCALLCYSIKLGFQDAACSRRLLEAAFASIVKKEEDGSPWGRGTNTTNCPTLSCSPD